MPSAMQLLSCIRQVVLPIRGGREVWAAAATCSGQRHCRLLAAFKVGNGKWPFSRAQMPAAAANRPAAPARPHRTSITPTRRSEVCRNAVAWGPIELCASSGLREVAERAEMRLCETSPECAASSAAAAAASHPLATSSSAFKGMRYEI